LIWARSEERARAYHELGARSCGQELLNDLLLDLVVEPVGSDGQGSVAAKERVLSRAAAGQV